MIHEPVLPADAELVRTTPEFDERTVPPGLLKPHQIAAGVWGNLVVIEGAVNFVFEDEPWSPRTIRTGESQPIPPARPHRVVLNGETRFAVEFYKPGDSNE